MSPRAIAAVLLLAGLGLGTIADRSDVRLPPEREGYRILEVDLHVHSFLGDGALAPWDLLWEARRRGLHAFVITNHNQIATARLGRWLSERLGGPIVLVGQELTAPGYHLVAAGIDSTVDWRLPAARAIAAVHAQGGVAIAAHPLRGFSAYDAEALSTLDGTEVMHPLVYSPSARGGEILEFSRRVGPQATPIGSSDFHSFTTLGLCRTYVFVQEVSERGILDAIRARRTVVFDQRGQAYGDPQLQRLIEPESRQRPLRAGRLPTVLDVVGAVCGWVGLVGLALFGGSRAVC